MKLEELNTIDELSQFISGTQKVIFTLKGNKKNTGTVPDEKAEI